MIDGMKKSFMTACKNASIPYGREELNGITFHDIRRTVKTYMLKAGIDKVYRDLILGHSLIGMDVHYLSPTDNDLKKAMEQYTDWLDKNIKKTF
jgi:integrase